MVGALLLYMAFLMLVDPLIRKPDAYTEQLHNEEENEVTLALWANPKAGVPLLTAPVIFRLLFPIHFLILHQATAIALCPSRCSRRAALSFPDTWHQAGSVHGY